MKPFYLLPIFSFFACFMLWSNHSLYAKNQLNLGSSSSKESFVETPNPLNLRPQWWQHFKVQDEKIFSEKIDQFIHQLHLLIEPLSPRDFEIALAHINRIKTNLLALPSAKQQHASSSVEPHVFKDYYSLEELLNIAQTLRKLEIEGSDDEEALGQQTQKVRHEQGNIDNLMATYLLVEESSTGKLLSGLNIIAHRASLAILEESTRFLKEKVTRHKLSVEQVKDELEHATNALQLTSFNKEELESEIAFSRSKFEIANQNFYTVESNAIIKFSDIAEDRATRHLWAQKVVDASVERALKETNLFLAEGKQLFFHYANDILDMNTKSLRKKIDSLEEKLEAYAQKMAEWQEATDKEQDRAGQDYALLIQIQNGASEIDGSLHQERLQQAQNTLSRLQLIEEAIFSAKFVLAQLTKQTLEKSSWWERWEVDTSEFFLSLWENLVSWMNFSLFKISGVPFTLLSILKIVVILKLSHIVSILLRSALMAFGERRGGIAESTLYVLGRLGHYSILVIGMIIALISIGLDFSNLALVAGALSVGIGFGLQSIVNNFLSGLVILFERSLKIGDYIELESGYRGKVIEINVQNTVIHTNDGIDVVIPNSELNCQKLINWTMTDSFRRLHIPFSVAYGSDKDLVRKIIIETANNLPYTLKGLPSYGEPQVWLTNFGESSLDLELIVWVNLYATTRYNSTMAAYLWEIESTLVREGIEIPFPQQDLHIKEIPESFRRSINQK